MQDWFFYDFILYFAKFQLLYYLFIRCSLSIYLSSVCMCVWERGGERGEERGRERERLPACQGTCDARAQILWAPSFSLPPGLNWTDLIQILRLGGKLLYPLSHAGRLDTIRFPANIHIPDHDLSMCTSLPSALFHCWLNDHFYHLNVFITKTAR